MSWRGINTENSVIRGSTVCRGVKKTLFINKLPIIGYPPFFRILLTPPPPTLKFTASQPSSDKGYLGVVVLSIGQD